MRTLLICHEEATIHREGLVRWLASFSDLAGVLVLRETRAASWRRVRRELRRSGLLGLADVLALRLYYRLAVSARDARWTAGRLAALRARYPAPGATPHLVCASANGAEAERFIRERRPDVVLALCKTLLTRRIFDIPAHGTYVLHPGICPEYRNAHGCFWALAGGDVDRVGMTLLRIDEGVDTGPVYGHFGYAHDELRESHVVIQHRVVLENLDRIAARLVDIVAGRARPIDTSGRTSAVWGQPRLSRYLKWKLQARRRRREVRLAPVP